MVPEVAIHCSFCARPEAAVNKVIAGPGVYICDGCVALCDTILAEDRAAGGKHPQLPGWESMSDQELLGHQPRVARVADQVEANQRQWVHRARERGLTWSRIGAALQMTRQSAWGRFSGEE